MRIHLRIPWNLLRKIKFLENLPTFQKSRLSQYDDRFFAGMFAQSVIATSVVV